MNTFQTIITIINTIALILVPIIVVYLTRHLQDRAELRKDKMDIFKTLMTTRHGWTKESVGALNIIDIVFSDDDKVRQNWKDYYEKVCVENPNDTQLRKIKQAQDKLIESIAISLGYRDKITWETIQNPYVPKWMLEEQQFNRDYQNLQRKVMENAGDLLFDKNIQDKNAMTDKQ